jgi:hypothetical protein
MPPVHYSQAKVDHKTAKQEGLVSLFSNFITSAKLPNSQISFQLDSICPCAHAMMKIKKNYSSMKTNLKTDGRIPASRSIKEITAYVVRVANKFTQYTLPATPGPPDNETDAAAVGATRLVRFSCWCPKIMAAIGRLPDTLADRCIVVRMQRKIPSETCERLKNLEATPLRRQCARFVQDHAEEIAGAHPALPTSMNDRAGDIWEPLLTWPTWRVAAGRNWPVNPPPA